jgi:hypothetical protein
LEGLAVKELPSPPDAAADPEAVELLRAWVVAGDLHCSLRTGGFTDPGTWGVLLADVVRNVARALREQEGRDPPDTVQRIRTAFEHEMAVPAEDPEDGAGGA